MRSVLATSSRLTLAGTFAGALLLSAGAPSYAAETGQDPAVTGSGTASSRVDRIIDPIIPPQRPCQPVYGLPKPPAEPIKPPRRCIPDVPPPSYCDVGPDRVPPAHCQIWVIDPILPVDPTPKPETR